nr:MAG TPA: hypothetical protein [Caudoviricetes sp.]
MVISTSKYSINTEEIPNKYLVFVIFNYIENRLFTAVCGITMKTD